MKSIGCHRNGLVLSKDWLTLRLLAKAASQTASYFGGESRRRFFLAESLQKLASAVATSIVASTMIMLPVDIAGNINIVDANDVDGTGGSKLPSL